MNLIEVLFCVVLVLAILTGNGKADLMNSITDSMGEETDRVPGAAKQIVGSVPSLYQHAEAD
ncbi:hypothetical protein FF38_02145 [Lucilia cuprina]|uniref:Uncharacterized protein n=1 Tax=Lucilia cuprina TaxID=7375 RepID=A0A0L0BZN8_LUCCU|nr:hypothetical protein CVS40_8872 [Lucilia cuprina]KNC25451.1 hypothetical protein FF38_02145 [Lucilia cuprina]